ncbi:hypothetical protein B7494_g5218 [Chlorociboria aeruginascens]|nr:hypothetical protein B7494_g5218 [Chlorociboria aeruginascens]
MSPDQGKNIAAVIETAKARITITVRPIPTAGRDEIVVRNYAIAANPADWKIQDSGFIITQYPTVLGSDISGVVHSIGSSVTKFSPGDRVMGFAGVIYNNQPDHGAWQTYTLLREINTTRIPNFMSFEEGSVFPMACATAACALFINLEIPRPFGSVKEREEGFLVWGAASAVGSATIQIARNLGFKVFATASPAHHQRLKSLGAFELFAYRDADVVSKIAAAATKAGTTITMGFDTVTEGETAKLSADVLISCSGVGKLVLVNQWPSKDPKPEGIEILNAMAARVGTDSADMGAWFFNEWLRDELEKKSIVPSPPIEIVEGGLPAAQKALDMLKKGVSGKKLVVKVD